MYIIFLLKGPDLRSLIYHYDLFVSIDRRLANRSHLVLKFVQFFISVYRVSKLTIWPFNNVSSCSTHLLLKKVYKAQNLHVNNLCCIRSVILLCGHHEFLMIHYYHVALTLAIFDGGHVTLLILFLSHLNNVFIVNVSNDDTSIFKLTNE